MATKPAENPELGVMLWHDGVHDNGDGVRLFVVHDPERPIVLRVWPEGQPSVDITLTVERAKEFLASLPEAIHVGLTETASA